VAGSSEGLAVAVGFLTGRYLPSLAVARARRLRRGSRAVLLWALGFFAAAQAGLVLALDYWHPALTESWWEHKWGQLRQLAAREADRPLLVMVGSSRTDDALQAERLQELLDKGGKPLAAYNLGVPMVGPLREGLYLDAMLEAGIRPHLLLVEFLPPFLNQPRKGYACEENWALAPWWTLAQFRRLWPYLAHPNRKRRDWLEARLVPWYGLRSHLCKWVSEKVVSSSDRLKGGWEAWPHDDHGYLLPQPFTPEETLRISTRTRATFSPTLRQFRLGEGPIRAMRDLLDRCRRERIPVVLVLMPESTEFSRWYCPEGLADARRLFGELACEYGADAVDATRWVDDADFRDFHHVQGEGARAFTTRLIDALRPILARKEM
jgi:hypothetical protein